MFDLVEAICARACFASRCTGGGSRAVLVECCWVEGFFVEVVVVGTRCGTLVSEHLGELIDAHLAEDLHVSRAHVHSAVLHLVFTRNQDVVPLVDLRISDLLLDVALGAVQFSLEAELVQVEVNRLAVVLGLLADGAHDDLSGREPEWPLTSQMLRQDCCESLDRAQDCSMDNHRSAEARL